jgi:leucyl aminopeptidase
MAIEITSVTEPPAEVDAWGTPVTKAFRVFAPGAEVDEQRCARRRFKAKVGDTVVIDDAADGLRVLVGVGTIPMLTTEVIRRAAGGFTRAVEGCTTACLDLRGFGGTPVTPDQALRAAAEGMHIAARRFDRFKTDEETVRLSHMVIVTDAEDPASALLKAGVVGAAVNLARDLIDEPAGTMMPRRLAEVAAEVAESGGLDLTVLDEQQIAEERLGGLMGVAAGSTEPPRLLKLVYEPDESVARRVDGRVPLVVIVGKGITFDSGGLSLKTGEGMMTMKNDMGGAAATIATLGACRALGVGVRVIGITPVTENMPSGTATKPGDVLVTRSGKTIEVLNTDAEGRLVLADGLTLAVEESPDAIVDIATLTGACIVALGRDIAGLMGNNDELIDQVGEASKRAGEPTWPLPLPFEYRPDIDSEIADIKNIGKTGSAGTLIGGLFLKEFVEDVPWVHLDIAGPARSEVDKHYLRKGATGFGVRTLIELVSTFVPVAREDDDEKHDNGAAQD